MPYADLLLGLRALFLESPETDDLRGLLARRAPGLAPAERETLASLPADRLAVYAGLLRENQSTMLGFVAPATVEAAEQRAGVPRREFARATLLETPRASSRLRELAQRIVDHLRGPGAAWVARCPALLDLARLEREQLGTFYAPDDEDALAPPAFAERVGAATVDEVLTLEARRAAATRAIDLDHDVLAWRTARYEGGAWGEPPPRLAEPLRVLLCRDPADLQATPHVLPPALHGLLTSDAVAAWTPLEAWAVAWIEATGVAPNDPAAAGLFFEQMATWVRMGAVAVRPPTGLPDVG